MAAAAAAASGRSTARAAANNTATAAAAAADDDALLHGPEALATYSAEIRKAAASRREELALLRRSREAATAAVGLLTTLPTRLRHEVVVPFGRHAFFPGGSLVRTNEVVVHLGGQHYAEVTAAAARDILQRRAALVDEGIEKAREQLRALESRLDVSAGTIGAERPVGSAAAASAASAASAAASTSGVRRSGDGGDFDADDEAGPLADIRETEEEAEAWRREVEAAAPGRPSSAAAAAAAADDAAAGAGAESGGDDDEEYWAALMRAEAEADALAGDEDGEDGEGGGGASSEAVKRAEALLRQTKERLGRAGPGPAAAESGRSTRAASPGGSGRRVTWSDSDAERRMAEGEAGFDSDDDDDDGDNGVGGVGVGGVGGSGSGGGGAPTAEQRQQKQPSKPKSILKQGFLVSRSSSGGGGGGGGGGSSTASGSTAAQRQAAAAKAAATSATPRVPATPVIGAVVERPAAAITELPPVVEREAADADSAVAAPQKPAAAGRRMSKFKMQRLGLDDPEGDGDGGLY